MGKVGKSVFLHISIPRTEKINIEEELVAQGSQVAELPEFTLFRDFGLIIVQIHSFGFFS